MKIYLVNGKRTAFGRFGGTLKNISPVDLAVDCSKALLDGLNLSAEQIDHVILGNVLPATTDTLYGARHLALKLGAKQSTPAYMVNRLCGSGIQAIADAFYMIKREDAQCVLAAGSENMSLAPHLVYGSRFGTKYGPLKTVDMLMDSLTDQYAGCPMAITAENLAQQYKLSRLECDEFALASHQKAVQAIAAGMLSPEIGSVQFPTLKDEHVRGDTGLEELAKLRPSFKSDGVVTAGNASGIVDGAASAIVANEKFIQTHSLEPLAEIIDMSVIGVDPKIMGIGPVGAIQNLLAKNKLSLNEIDFIEINEAFAAQALACQRELGIDREKLNVWGGAIAYGHPLAASGVRISLMAARQLKHYKKKMAIASACIGGGQGIALLLKSV